MNNDIEWDEIGTITKSYPEFPVAEKGRVHVLETAKTWRAFLFDGMAWCKLLSYRKTSDDANKKSTMAFYLSYAVNGKSLLEPKG